MKIDSFKGDFEFLSNFYPVVVTLDGVKYPTVEHAFQAAKTLNLEQRRWVASATTPGEAKKRGRKVALRDEWENMKLAVMLELLRQKFAYPYLGNLLTATLDAELEEGNWWGDAFWGTVRGAGENWLGQLLMHVRKEVVQGRQIPIMFLNQRGRVW